MQSTGCRKAYVSVNVDVDEEGCVHPRYIRWEDIIEQMIPDERYEALYLNECEEQSCEDTDVILAAIARETISDGEEVFESVFRLYSEKSTST